jgi:hypothetical protein
VLHLILSSCNHLIFLRGAFHAVPMPFPHLNQPVYLPLYLLQRIKALTKGASLCANSSPVADEVKVAKQSVLNRYGVEAVSVLLRVDAGKASVYG